MHDGKYQCHMASQHKLAYQAQTNKFVRLQDICFIQAL